MLRKNFMNGLLGLVAVGVLLTGYNALIAGNEEGRTATNKIAQYLNLDVAVQEPSEAANTQVTVDEGSTDESVAVDTPQPAESADSTQKKTEESKVQTNTPAVPAGDKAQSVYTVKEGDTYGCIAEKYYGSYEHWTDVVGANPYTEGFTEYELHVGAQIVLPAVSGASLKPASTLCS
jgi:LysM repeat protein